MGEAILMQFDHLFDMFLQILLPDTNLTILQLNIRDFLFHFFDSLPQFASISSLLSLCPQFEQLFFQLFVIPQ